MMNKLVECFRKNCLADDMLFATYGLSSEEYFDCAFVAPCWGPEKIFDIEKIDIEPVYEDRCSTSFRIRCEGRKYLFIKLQIGAPNIVDFCLLCSTLNCDNFVIVGSAGALVSEINLGDVIVPNCAITGNGATVYLSDNFKQRKLFEKVYSSHEFNERIRDICYKHDVKAKDVTIVSVDSLVAEYIHVEEFRQMGAEVIEMEAATFFEALRYVGKNAAALLVISDNSSTGKHLIGRTDEDRINYHKSRSALAEILLSL